VAADMKKKMASRHLVNGLGMALFLALFAGLVYVTVLFSSDGDDSRVKRSLLADNEYLFKNGVHKVHWAKKQTDTTTPGLPNPGRYDKKSPLDYIFISVKTATKFHMERLQVIIDTWFKLAPDQVKTEIFTLHKERILRQ
jgi:hypothetical protein